MSTLIILWIWFLVLVAELVVAPPIAIVPAVRVCLEANEFRELSLLSSILHIHDGPRVFSVVLVDNQCQDMCSTFSESPSAFQRRINFPVGLLSTV